MKGMRPNKILVMFGSTKSAYWKEEREQSRVAFPTRREGGWGATLMFESSVMLIFCTEYRVNTPKDHKVFRAQDFTSSQWLVTGHIYLQTKGGPYGIILSLQPLRGWSFPIKLHAPLVQAFTNQSHWSGATFNFARSPIVQSTSRRILT